MAAGWSPVELPSRCNNCPFWDGLLLQLPLLQPAAVLPSARQAMRTYNAMGVTTVYEGHLMGVRDLGVYRTLRNEDALSLRVLVALEAEPYRLPWTKPLSEERFQIHLERALSLRDLSDDWLRINGVTFTRGGPCWPGFMRLRQPYQVRMGNSRPECPLSRQKRRGPRWNSPPHAGCG